MCAARMFAAGAPVTLRGQHDDVGLVLEGQVLGDVAAVRDHPIGLGRGETDGSIEAKI